MQNDKAKLMIVLSPVGPYYATGFKPVSLHCETNAIRSAPKGTGAFKLGGYLLAYLGTMLLLFKQQLKLKNMAINKFYGFSKDKFVRWDHQTFSLSSRTKEEKSRWSPHRLKT